MGSVRPEAVTAIKSHREWVKGFQDGVVPVKANGYLNKAPIQVLRFLFGHSRNRCEVEKTICKSYFPLHIEEIQP